MPALNILVNAIATLFIICLIRYIENTIVLWIVGVSLFLAWYKPNLPQEVWGNFLSFIADFRRFY